MTETYASPGSQNVCVRGANVARISYSQPSRDYVARCTAKGKTKTEIIRCL
jgi:hypothetical protein